MTEEERKRRGLQLTDEYERYVQDVLSARAAGVNEPRPITQVDTESGPEYRTLQKYVDARDEMIESSPALVRPAYSILDRMLRPGRAGMADRMNREYMEGLLQRDSDQRRALAERQLIEAQGQKMQADAVVAGLQRTVAEGGAGAKEAADRLRQIGVATGRVTPQGQDLYGMLFDQEKRSQRGVAKPIGAEGATPSAPATTPAATAPALTNISDMTRSEFNEYVPNKSAQLDNEIEAVQKIIDTEKIEELRPNYGGDSRRAGRSPKPYLGGIKTQREATFGEIEAAKARLKELQKEKQQLESTAELYSPTGSRQ